MEYSSMIYKSLIRVKILLFFEYSNQKKIDTMTWVQAYVTGTHPGARSRHTANVLPAGMLFPVSPSPTNSPGKNLYNYHYFFHSCLASFLSVRLYFSRY